MNQWLLFFQNGMEAIQGLYQWLFTPTEKISQLLGAPVAPIWILLGGGLIIIFFLHVVHLVNPIG